MIKLLVKVPDGLQATDAYIFLSKSHPFVVTTRSEGGQRWTVIKDGIHNNGGWLVFDDIEDVLSKIEEQGS